MEEDTAHPRRYAKACDACHKKKIKCIYSEGGCDLCQKTGKRCKFTRIEKAMPKRPRRGKYLAALEERMKSMEELLQNSGEKPTQQDEVHETPSDGSISEGALATIINRGPLIKCHKTTHPAELVFPRKDQAMHLVQGYFASSNHLFPIFDKHIFMLRMGEEYPPGKHSDLVWWSTVVTVLCYAHRLRAMSRPLQAEVENQEACRYIWEALDVAPKLTYAKPSIGSAQVLLGIASILRGTAMPDPAPMLVSVAIRMLQDLDAQKEESREDTTFCVRKERERIFWIAYILDKDIALQMQKPPVLHQQDIGRPPLEDREKDSVGIVRSLDSYFEVNLFAVSQRLATIQDQVWSRIHSAAMITNRNRLKAAQDELNPVLAAWKKDLPFEFKCEDLVGRWPKHAILHIVVLHFRYFHTLVELNKDPPMDKDDMSPLNGDCPVAKSLPRYPHSTSMLAVEAARDALDLAALTPRGNFQNVWMFFHFSISAVLTLQVNGIVRPLNDQAHCDLRRVDTWLNVVDILATSSERPDLLEKKEFLDHMKGWTLHALQNATSGTDSELQHLLPCLSKLKSSNMFPDVADDETNLDSQRIPELGHVQPDVFPLGLLNDSNLGDSWSSNVAFNWAT